MKKTVIVSSIIVFSASSPVISADSSESTYYITNPVTSEIQEVEDDRATQAVRDPGLGGLVDLIDEKLDFVDELLDPSLLSGKVGDIIGWLLGKTSVIGNLFGADGQIGSFLSDVSSLAHLVARVASYPQQISTWYEQTLAAISGELDPCLRSPDLQVLPEYVFTPGWCIGMGENSTAVTSDGSTTSNNSFAVITGGTTVGSGGTGSDGSTSEGSSSVAQTGISLSQLMSEAAQGTAIGIPDPLKLRALVGQNIVDATDGGDLFAVNPRIARQYTLNNAERATVRTNINSVLSKAGQQRIQDAGDGALETIASGLQTAAGAQNANATQDVVKSIAEAQSQQTLLLGTILNTELFNRSDQAMTQMMLSNISQELDRQTAQEINLRNAVYRSLLRNYHQVGLY